MDFLRHNKINLIGNNQQKAAMHCQSVTSEGNPCVPFLTECPIRVRLQRISHIKDNGKPRMHPIHPRKEHLKQIGSQQHKTTEQTTCQPTLYKVSELYCYSFYSSYFIFKHCKDKTFLLHKSINRLFYLNMNINKTMVFLCRKQPNKKSKKNHIHKYPYLFVYFIMAKRII